MKKYLKLYKSKFCSLLWLLLGLEALVVIYLLSPAPIDPLIVLEPNFASIEGDNILYEEGKPARYTVSVSQNLDKELNVTLSYGGGAVRGVDYNAPSVVVIKKGDMNTSFEITAIDDNELEGEELFSVKIASINGKNFMEPLRPQDLGGVVYTKVLDETKHQRKVHKPDLLSIVCAKTLHEDNATALCHIKSIQKAYENINIGLKYSGSAILGEDYNAPNSVVLPQGKSDVSFKLKSIDDAYKEGIETIKISIDTIDGGGFEEKSFDKAPAIIKLSDEVQTTQITKLSINNIEKIEEGGAGTYTLALSREPINDLTVYLKRNEGAKKFNIPEKVVFTKGERQKQFRVKTVDDNIKEKRDFIKFSIAKVKNSSFERLSYANSAVKTKVIDEPVPVEADADTAYVTLSTPTSTIDEAVGSVEITLKSSQAVARDTKVVLKLAHETAPERKYILNKTVIIKKGTSSAVTTLKVLDNNIVQGEDKLRIEVVKLGESGLEDLRIKSPLTLSVIDDTQGKLQAGISLKCPKQLFENSQKAVCHVNLSEVTQKEMRVTLSYEGNATYGVDYDAPQSVRVGKGKKSATFVISSIDDIEKEGAEDIEVGISSVDQDYFETLKIDEKGTSTLLRDEKRPTKIVYLTLTVDKEVKEGDATPMRLSLSETALKDVNVVLHMPKSKDYVTVEQVVIPKGAKEVSFAVQSLNDNIKEQNSYLPVSIKQAKQDGFERLRFDRRMHRVHIIDDANINEAAVLTFKADNEVVYEDDPYASIRLQLSQTAQKDMKISLKTSGEAIDGVDYKMPSSVVLRKDKKEVTFKIHPLNDNIIEQPEMLTIAVVKHQDGGLERITADKSITLTLKDDRNITHSLAAMVSLKGPSKVAEPKRSKPYTVSLSQKAEKDMGIYLYYTGEATEKDYVPVQSVTIKKGSKIASFSIETIDNDEVQPVRHFSVAIARVEGGGLENIKINKHSVKTNITDKADIDAAFNSIVKEQIIKFESGSTEVGETAKKTLDKIADLFKQFPSARLTVEGYTNHVGSAKYNLVLSQKRANSIKRYLVSKGIDVKRIRAVGYGESRPLLKDNSKEALEFNKRVEFKVKY